MDLDDTLMNSIVGGVVAVVLTPLNFSPVVGGAVAGYLEGDDGVRVGAIAGAIAAIPLVLFTSLLGGVSILPFVGFGDFGGILPAALGIIGALFAFVLGVLFTVALGALGGYLGVYLQGELDV